MAYCDPNIEGTGGELSSGIDTTKPVFDDYKTAKYHKLTDFVMGEVFRKHTSYLGWTPNNLTNVEDLKKLIVGIREYLKNGLIDTENEDAAQPLGDMSYEAYTDIKDVLVPSFDQFIGHYLRFNSVVSNAESVVEDGLPENEQTLEDTSVEQSEAVSLEEIADEQGPKFERPGNDISAIEMASKNVKLIFRLIPKAEWNETTQQVELFKDADGLPTTADFGPVFNKLLITLSGTRDFTEMMNKLKDVDTLRVVPEAQYIAEILKVDKPNSQRTIGEYNLLNEFYQQFSKPKIQLQSAVIGEDGNLNVFDEISGNLSGIREQFTSDFQLGYVHDNVKKFLKVDELQGYSLYKPENETLANHLPVKPHTFNDRIEFLSLLGINLSGIQFLDSEAKRDDFDKMLTETVNFLYDSVSKRLNAGQVIREPLTNLRDKFVSENGKTVIQSERKSLDRLIDFESKYSNVTPSLSTRTANGELAYLISLDNQLSIVTYHLNHSDTLQELLATAPFKTAKYNPLFKNSYIIQFLFDDNGNKRVDPLGQKRTIDLSNLSGFKRVISDRTFSKLEREVPTTDKFIQDLNMMWNNGKTDVLRPETSHSFFTIGIKDFNNEARRYFPVNGFISDFKSNNGFRRVIYNYLTAEIERVKSYDKKKEENPDLPATYGQFSIFYETLEHDNPTLKDEILKFGKFDQDSAIFTRFMNSFENQLVREVQNLKDEMNKLGLSKVDVVSQNAKKLINGDIKKDEVLSDVDFNSLLRTFVANTLVQNVEFSILYGVDPLYTMEFHKRLKGVSSTGDLAAIHSLFTEYRQSPYEQLFHKKYSITGILGRNYRNNDKNFHTKTLIEYKQSPDFAYTRPNMVDDIYTSLVKRDGVNTKFTKDYIERELLNKKEDQKPADGQGYISLDAHREFSLRFGVHTPEIEAAYKYEGLIFKRDIARKEMSDIENEELANLEKLIYANPNKFAIPVWKVTYWGGIENTTVDTRALDKLSLAPLLPSDVKNHPKLSKLLLDMTNSQISYVKYKSGTKLYTTTPVDINNIAQASPDEYSTELLRMQIKAKSQQNDSTAIPTQLLKLVFSNLFNAGKPVNDKVGELYKSYITILKSIQGYQGANLLEELGISDSGVDMKKLSERLIEQAKKQGLNSNTIKALRLDGNTLAGVLEESGFVKQIVDLVAGLADKRLRRWEMPGGDFVLVSNANRDKLNFYKYDENGTIAADIRITLNGEFVKLLNKIHPDGKPIGTRERLNTLLENKKWRKENEKLLTVVMGRVPIQGPNSMEFGIVKEFLPATAGNVIILPEEIVFKSGLDFDYDKQKVMTPSFTKDGRYIEDISSIDTQIEALKKQREGIITEFYTSKNPSENIQKIREYITDVRNILVSGKFDSLTAKTGDKAAFKKNMEELKSLFTEVVNMEIAKEGFDDIINRIETYKDYETPVDKFPSVPDARFEQFAASELESLRDEINEVTGAFYGKVNEFTKGEVFNVINEGYKFKDKIISLLQMKGRELEENYNKIVELYKDVLSLPEMYAELVTPNSTKTVSPLADRNAALKGTSLNLPTRNKVLNYLDNLHVRDTLFSAKNMLGAFANDNTYMEMMQYLGIDINGTYFKKWGKNFVERTITHPLLYASELDKIRTGNRIKTSLRDDVENYIKQHYTSESINFTVDSAKDPRFALLNIMWKNVGVVNFMKLMGYPFSRIIDFINQPVILKYMELMKNRYTKNDALAKMGEILGISKDTEVSELINEKAYLEKKKDPNFKPISEEKLAGGRYRVKYKEVKKLSHWDVMDVLRRIDNRQSLPKFRDIAKKLTYTNLIPQLVEKINAPILSDDYNLRIFAHFFTMDEHSSSFRNFHYYFNNDKVKVSTPTNLKDKDNMRQTLFSQKMFSESDLIKMENESIVSAFMNNEMLKKTFKSILPVIGREDVQQTLDTLYRDYSMAFGVRNDRDLRNMPKVLTTDFITATVFNFNIEDGKSFIERNRHLLIKERGKRTIADRLDALKKQPFYPKLVKQFPVLNQFVISSHRIKDTNDLNGLAPMTIIKNIKLIKPFSETSVEEEGIIDQLRTLQTFKIKDRKYTKEERKVFNEALHRFMIDLFNVGVLQSGFNKTYIGFSEYIPQEYIRGLFAPALKTLDSLSPAQFSNFLARFENQFRYNNPKYFPRIKRATSKDSIRNNNDYSNRFKMYDQNLNYVIEAVEEDENPDQEEQPTVTQPVISEKIDISNSTKKSTYFEKDRLKFANANKLISRGSPASSSEAYRIAAGNKANVGTYTSSDIVAISAEGNRKGRIKADFEEIEKAAKANVTFITDNTKDRERPYNIGEREVADFLMSRGYSEKGDGIWTKETTDNSKVRASSASDIYSKLGNKTVSGNVRIESWNSLKNAKSPFTEAMGSIVHVISTRIPNSEQHFGNPFSHDPAGKTLGLIKTETIREAVEKYIDWVINSSDARANWIREQLKSGRLKGKPILYFKELGEPSHATALDYLINQYDWSAQTENTIQPSNLPPIQPKCP